MKVLLLSLFLIIDFSSGYAQTARTLSLAEAETLALKQNPLLRMQYDKIEAQKGVYWLEMIPENPEFGIEVEQIPKNSPLKRYGEKRVYVSQSLDFPTNYIFRHKSLNAEIQRERFRTEEFKRELIFQVKQAYFNVLLQEKLLGLARKNLELSQEFYDRSKRSYELGETDRLTVLKAKVNLGNAHKQLNGEEKNLDAAIARLRQVLGFKEDERLKIVLTDSIPQTIQEYSYEKLKPGIRIHPALKAAQTEQLAALNASRLAYGGFLPQISLSYFKQKIADQDFWGGGISLSFPLWFFGQKGRVQEQNARFSMARYFVSAENLRLTKDFHQAMANFQKAVNEVRLYQTSLLSEAQEVFRIAQKSYSVGEIGYLQFIDAQQTLINTQSGYLRSLTNYQIEKAHLTKLVGEEL